VAQWQQTFKESEAKLAQLSQQNGIKAIQDLPTQKWIEYSTRYSCEPF
jgi:hypothetical protein